VYHKWQGLHWVLASLADLGYPRGDATLGPVLDRSLAFWLRPAVYREYEADSEKKGYGRVGVPRIEGRYRRCASQQGSALLYATRLGLGREAGDRLVERLLHWQWPDGGWNCDRRPAAHVSSFFETRLPMMGLAAHARTRGSARARAGARRARAVFLRRRLFRRASNGRVMRSAFTALHYPLYWYYDALGGLKAMMEVGRLRDPRCAEALDLLETKRLPDGGWPAEARFYRTHSRRWQHHADYVDWGGTNARRANEWVTADALTVLRAAGRFEP
jgi:hypothetical protein